MAANPSTVWAQLSGINAAAGGIPFIGPDNATPIADVANLWWNQDTFQLAIGFDHTNPQYNRYGTTQADDKILAAGGINSYVSVADQATVNMAELSVASSRGTSEIPSYILDDDDIGRIAARGYTGVAPSFQNLVEIVFGADGTTADNLGGKMEVNIKQNGGVLATAITILQDLSVTFAGVVNVAGSLVLSGSIAAAAFIPVVSVAVPTDGMYSDAIHQIDFAINSNKRATITATGINDTVIGASTPQAGSFVGLTATGAQAVTLTPAGANVVLAPTTTGVVTIAPNTAGTINNMVIGGTTPLAGTFTTLGGTTITGSTAVKGLIVDSSTGGAFFYKINGNAAASTAVFSHEGSAASTFKLTNNTGAGGNFDFVTSTGSQLRVQDGGARFVAISGSATSPSIDTSAGNLLIKAANVTGITVDTASNVYLGGTSTTNQSFKATNTALAVNFIEAIGQVTGTAPQLKFGGTDATPGGRIILKGTAPTLTIANDSGNTFATITGTGAGNAAILSSAANPFVDTSAGSLLLKNAGTTALTLAGANVTVAGQLTTTGQINFATTAFSGITNGIGCPTGNTIAIVSNGTTAASFTATSLVLAGTLTRADALLGRSTTAATNNAAAQVATITNGPTAGNPTKWIPYDDNGTTRNIPAW